MQTLSQIPAAQYLRMSSDQQKLSLPYQRAAIQRYAERHGFNILKTYEDPGRSGLTLKHRPGLGQLLHDVVKGDQRFKAILVYDVSRWGRFQDTDEAAHYEFVCRRAGTPIYYCAETFKNNCSPPDAIMKTLKRIMAAEYSRELSERLSRAKKIMTQRGYRAGGQAGYGLRRMLVSNDGVPQRVLLHGEEKGFRNGRVILVPGPPWEVARVKEIYHLTVSEKKSAKAIARDFNRRGIKCAGVRWNDQRILEILQNQKYIGWSVLGRTSSPLGQRVKAQPANKWTVNTSAYEPIIDQQTFYEAQKVLKERTRYKSNEEMLEGLRRLLQREGRLSERLINLSRDIPSHGAYLRRFGTIQQAYALIGYQMFANNEGARRMRRMHRRIADALLRRLSKMFGAQASLVRERAGCRRVLCFQDGLKISILTCQYFDLGNGTVRWGVAVNRFERGYPTLICRCAPDNLSFKDYYLVPRIETQCKRRFFIEENDRWLTTGKRINNLSRLRGVAQRLASVNETAGSSA